jgi:type IV pilus assembly protein PilW
VRARHGAPSAGRRARGFSLLELLVAMVIGLAVIAAFLIVLQRIRRDFAASESLAHLHDSARHASAVITSDIEHAGFFGPTSVTAAEVVRGGATLAAGAALAQPDDTDAVAAVAGLPAGAHDCGVNFAVDLLQPVQGSDNHFALGRDAGDCEPAASAGRASETADTLTVRRGSLAVATPRAGRVQLYSAALSSVSPLRLFADGNPPGPVDADHEIRDLEVRSYYIATDSVGRRGWPALRVKTLTESRGVAQFRDEEVMPGVEDLQVELAVATAQSGATVVRYLPPGSADRRTSRVVAVRFWLRLRSDVTEGGHRDDRILHYANVVFVPSDHEARQRRMLVERTVALRNAHP